MSQNSPALTIPDELELPKVMAPELRRYCAARAGANLEERRRNLDTAFRGSIVLMCLFSVIVGSILIGAEADGEYYTCLGLMAVMYVVAVVGCSLASVSAYRLRQSRQIARSSQDDQVMSERLPSVAARCSAICDAFNRRVKELHFQQRAVELGMQEQPPDIVDTLTRYANLRTEIVSLLARNELRFDIHTHRKACIANPVLSLADALEDARALDERRFNVEAPLAIEEDACFAEIEGQLGRNAAIVRSSAAT